MLVCTAITHRLQAWYSATWYLGIPLVKEQLDGLYGWLNNTHQHLNMASNRMKARYDCLAKSMGFQEGD
jgi:hypothetical protein